jgi:hypothetical protein
MSQQRTLQLASNEASLFLALSAIKKGQIKSERRAAAMYNVSRSTLKRRRAGIPSQRDCEPNSKKMTKLEEEVIVQHILDLDSRGFAPNLEIVRDMANKLLAERAVGHVGVN